MTEKYLKYYLLLFIILVSCKGKTVITNSDRPQAGRTNIKYAQRFDLTTKDGYTVLTIINPWQGADNVNQTYYLLGRGLNIPAGIDSINVIRVPVNSIICMSTTHLSMISALNEERTIKGISGADFLYEPKLLNLIKDKQIADVGYEDNLNKELVIQISPDLIMVYGIGSESAGYLGKLKELGIRVIFNADYLEKDPLGKAEWIKVFGALFCDELKADSIFSATAAEYNNLKSFINTSIKERPSVFLGLPWKDTWFISPGNSYISRLISDAGGDYLWKDTNSEISMPFGIENVYIRALKADYWINPGGIKFRNEIAAVDNRLTELPSFMNGRVFNNNNRITQKGGNDYWESGSINPQIILKDIASILHPGLFPDYKLYYFRKIE
jgi:iron complex transport system substrate-binding protein